MNVASVEWIPFVRRPFFVKAVQVTEANMADIALWTKGKIFLPGDRTHFKTATGAPAKYIHIKVLRPSDPKQERAFVGNWVLQSGGGFKVYLDSAFQQTFQKINPQDFAGTPDWPATVVFAQVGSVR